MANTELKPCKCKGTLQKMKWYIAGDNKMRVLIQCVGCGKIIIQKTEKQAIAAWNKRMGGNNVGRN